MSGQKNYNPFARNSNSAPRDTVTSNQGYLIPNGRSPPTQTVPVFPALSSISQNRPNTTTNPTSTAPAGNNYFENVDKTDSDRYTKFVNTLESRRTEASQVPTWPGSGGLYPLKNEERSASGLSSRSNNEEKRTSIGASRPLQENSVATGPWITRNKSPPETQALPARPVVKGPVIPPGYTSTTDNRALLHTKRQSEPENKALGATAPWPPPTREKQIQELNAALEELRLKDLEESFQQSLDQFEKVVQGFAKQPGSSPPPPIPPKTKNHPTNDTNTVTAAVQTSPLSPQNPPPFTPLPGQLHEQRRGRPPPAAAPAKTKSSSPPKKDPYFNRRAEFHLQGWLNESDNGDWATATEHLDVVETMIIEKWGSIKAAPPKTINGFITSKIMQLIRDNKDAEALELVKFLEQDRKKRNEKQLSGSFLLAQAVLYLRYKEYEGAKATCMKFLSPEVLQLLKQDPNDSADVSLGSWLMTEILKRNGKLVEAKFWQAQIKPGLEIHSWYRWAEYCIRGR
ncbi:hypothetical protein TWF481_003157 [Arthrobotrys musiformis]|uniref:Uncharacterized protein n=1 Tax=Arthrobotrys musiformis TaxID=47236 RepID=A0AAV9VPK4_9PEZI